MAGRRSRGLLAAIQTHELGLPQGLRAHHEPDIGGGCIGRHVELCHLQRVEAQVVAMRLAGRWTRPAVSGSAKVGAPLYGACGQQVLLRVAGAGDPQKNLLPAGAVQGRTDFGTPGYGGPCPPPGKPHRYYLRLYALKVAKLDVPADATAAYIGFMVRMQSLGKAELMGVYGR